MRAVFMGTPEIAVPALEALADIAEIALVICQPDRPSGRGMKEKAPPIKVRALELGLVVEQPKKVRDGSLAARLRELSVDLALVMAYGRILPKDVLDAPRLGCINLHASILPAYRGAAPITWAVVNGDKETGISLMQMDEGMDTGAVFSIHRTPIGENDTAGDVSNALARLGRGVVSSDIPKVASGELTAIPQDHNRATEARMLAKQDGAVDWTKGAGEVHNHIRGMSPWPGATAQLSGKRFKLLETRALAGETSGAPPGTVLIADRDRIEIACGSGVLVLLKGQAEGRKALASRDLVAGRVIAAGMRFAALDAKDGT